MVDMPRLTLALNCYKVERFVTEAVEGAFAQTYRPLEIVISDDHSPDATWGKIVAAVIRLGGFASSETEAWQQPDFCGTAELSTSDGLHLVLNRNQRNLGLALHQNRIFELAHGEWIAFQAGDDVSMFERMEVIAKRVVTHPDIRCLHCPTHVIEADGNPYKVPESFLRLERCSKGRSLPYVLGAGAVYHESVYSIFGPIGAMVRNEDQVLPLRAKLLGSICFIEQRLVKYRKHGENASGTYQKGAKLESAKYRMRLLYARYQGLIDLHTADIDGLGNHKEINFYRKLIKQDIEVQCFMAAWEIGTASRTKLVCTILMSPMLLFLLSKRAIKRLLARVSSVDNRKRCPGQGESKEM